MKKKRIFWIAGEHSADLHSSLIIRQLNAENASISHYGIGGNHMQQEGFKSIFPFNRFCIMGFWEVFKHITFFMKVEAKIGDIFANEPPDLVILVDYPGLNMRVAEKASRLGIRVIYFISPQFWAWKFRRIEKMKKFVHHLCYILPFEKKYFDDYQIPSTYVGHPIAEEIDYKLSKNDFSQKFQLDTQKKWIGFFPGSRENEIKKLLPIYLQTIHKMDQDKYEFLISKAVLVNEQLFSTHSLPKNVKLIPENNYEMMKYCDFLVVKSGTTTLEAGYIGTPFIIVYISSRLSYEIGKRLVKIKRIGLVNIVLEEDLIPELVQQDVTSENIKKEILFYLSNPLEYNKIQERLEYLHQILGTKKASVEMAKIVRQTIE